MSNGFDRNLITYRNEAVLNIENTAAFLGISTATVRNWVKCGHLQTLENNTKYFFCKRNIEDVKSKIINGDLEKLSNRANKAKAYRTFAPDEYMQDKIGLDKLNCIIDFIKNNKIGLLPALLLTSLNLLKKEKILPEVNIQDVIQKRDLSFSNKQIKEEIISWISEIEEGEIKDNFSFLLSCDIPKQRDILGFLYQSLLQEGYKSQNGSYYTPSNIVDEIITEHVVKNSKVLDPCCGTGQFLLAFSNIVENPANIYGIDIDKTAVKIARLNILIKFKDKNFVPNIVCKNTLFDVDTCDLFSFKEKSTKIIKKHSNEIYNAK